jgi:hypothetical protein
MSRAQVDGKQLLARDLGHAVAAVAQPAAVHPASVLSACRLDHLRQRLLQRAHCGNHPQGGCGLQKAAPAQIRFGHIHSPVSKPKRRQASTPVAIDSQRCPTTGAALGYLHVDRHFDRPARRYRFQRKSIWYLHSINLIYE